MKGSVAQLCPILCDLINCSPPGSSVYGIFQARILEWVAISFSEDLHNQAIELESSALAGGFCTTEPPGKLPLPGFLAKHSPSQQDKIGRTQGVWGYFLCPECSSSLWLEN